MLADTHELDPSGWPVETCVIPFLTDSGGAFSMDTHAAVAIHDLSLTLVLYLTLYHTLVVLIDPMINSGA